MQAVGNNIIVKMNEIVSSGKIISNVHEKDILQWGTVVSAGSKVEEIKAGDVVLFDARHGIPKECPNVDGKDGVEDFVFVQWFNVAAFNRD